MHAYGVFAQALNAFSSPSVMMMVSDESFARAAQSKIGGRYMRTSLFGGCTYFSGFRFVSAANPFGFGSMR